ncbi:uncharacterized protein AstCC isoform X1 [Periplaneta americana]|uniref:uncharacterized protein AstCC isoform X1 n=1 Tax=Periplaneta americana TaxID=6978 RepID=UPI0037E7E119
MHHVALVLGALFAVATPTQVLDAAPDYPDDGQGVHYDEYPVVVPKRTALLLDRIMVALQKAVEDEKGARAFPDQLADSKVRLVEELKDSRPREFDPRIFRIRGRQTEDEATNEV